MNNTTDVYLENTESFTFIGLDPAAEGSDELIIDVFDAIVQFVSALLVYVFLRFLKNCSCIPFGVLNKKKRKIIK